jgi:hypothetical protein
VKRRWSGQLGGVAGRVRPAIVAYPGFEAMKVIDGLTAVAPGETVSLTELGLPVSGRQAVLLVFWKST